MLPFIVRLLQAFSHVPALKRNFLLSSALESLQATLWKQHVYSEFNSYNMKWGPAWGSVVVTALRYKSEGLGIDSLCRLGFFSVASDSSMCPGVDSTSKKMSTRLIMGVKAAGA
jgi:hypothetical protein